MILQSVFIFLLFAVGGVAGAFFMKFIAGLTNRVKEADSELTKIRNIKTKIYQVAIEAIQGMRLAKSVDLYKANFRAFRDALTDAEVLKIESMGIFRALYAFSVISPTIRNNELPDADQLKLLEDAEQKLQDSMRELLDEAEGGNRLVKSRKKKK